MRRSTTNRSALLAVGAAAWIALAATIAVGPVRAGLAVEYIYPTDTGCTTTLQACVDQAASGSTIHIATNTPIAEDVDVDKSLAIDAAPGFQPNVRGIFVVVSTAPAVGVTLDGLQLGQVIARFHGGTGHSFLLHDSLVERTSTSNSAYAVEFYSQVPAAFAVERSTLRSNGSQASTLSFITDLTAGPVTLDALANRIDQKDTNVGGPGIDVDLRGTGSVGLNLMNNVIWDVAGNSAGGAAGIKVSADDTLDVDLNIVGNTIELSQGSGLDLLDSLDVGGSFAIDVFDNIISHHDFAGINISRDPGSPQVVWRAGYNDLFANGANQLGGRPLGPGAMTVNPRFVDRAAGNLRLRSNSLLIDAGQVCTPGGVANPDVAGRHRLFGSSVDMGAYERGAPVPDGEVKLGDGTANELTGTNGRDILCGYGARDVMRGAGSADYIDGGTGPDVIFGDGGPDRMFGRKGGDLMCARDGAGSDLVNGGPGTDEFRADGGDTLISVETRHSCLP